LCAPGGLVADNGCGGCHGLHPARAAGAGGEGCSQSSGAGRGFERAVVLMEVGRAHQRCKAVTQGAQLAKHADRRNLGCFCGRLAAGGWVRGHDFACMEGRGGGRPCQQAGGQGLPEGDESRRHGLLRRSCLLVDDAPDQLLQPVAVEQQGIHPAAGHQGQQAQYQQGSNPLGHAACTGRASVAPAPSSRTSAVQATPHLWGAAHSLCGGGAQRLRAPCAIQGRHHPQVLHLHAHGGPGAARGRCLSPAAHRSRHVRGRAKLPTGMCCHAASDDCIPATPA